MLIDELAVAPRDVRDLVVGLDHTVVFDITAVALWLDEHWHQAGGLDLEQEFPNVAPLAQHAWMEFRHLNGMAYGVALIAVIDRDDPASVREAWDWGADVLALMERTDARWCLAAQYVVQLAGTGEIVVQGYGFYYHVARDGRLVCASALSGPGLVPFRQLNAEERALRAMPPVTALAATCFAHCKGVSATDHQQPRQQRRAAERAGRPPLVTYKTIDIAPVTRLLREQGRVEQTGLKTALHICRGHFAHYTDERPLFGKYTGTFYRPMHVRGCLERGLTLKDYRVLGPQDAS